MPDRSNQALPEASAPDNLSLATLLADVEKKDRTAFEKLYQSTIDKLFGLALRITHSPELAEEVLSDLYLQVWQQAGQYSPERGSVMAWLSVICRSRALDMLRRNQRNLEKEEPLQDTAITIQEGLWTQDLLVTLEEQSTVHKALLKLDGNSRQLLALAYFKGYSHTEMARFTGIPVGTVKTQIRRAVIALKENMLTTREQSRDSNE